MSLIDEALRRARQQAASQESARRDERYRQVPILPPMAARRDRSAGPALVAGAVAVCVVAGIGIGVFLGRRAGEERAVPVETVQMPPAPEETAPPVETPRSPAVPAQIVEEVTPLPASSPTPAPRPEETPRQELPASEVEPFNPPPVLDTAPASPTPEITPEPVTPEVRTYVREVPLPDGGTLRLNGIAFSSTQPVALLNDRVLGKGESYQGFTITDIQAGVVELQGNGMIVRVSLK
jgi:hypothetical protein